MLGCLPLSFPTSLLAPLDFFLALRSQPVSPFIIHIAAPFLPAPDLLCPADGLAKALVSLHGSIYQIQSSSQDHPPPKSLSSRGSEGEGGSLLLVSHAVDGSAECNRGTGLEHLPSRSERSR